MTKKILMICLGNICRSPIAEAVMQETINKSNVAQDWHVDSAALEGWHSGCDPDKRALSVMQKHGITYNNTARQITNEDFNDFDYIFGMDESNMSALNRSAPSDSKAKLLMLGNFGLKTEERIIVDPYYLVGEAPFEKVYEQCVVACDSFLKQALKNEI